MGADKNDSTKKQATLAPEAVVEAVDDEVDLEGYQSSAARKAAVAAASPKVQDDVKPAAINSPKAENETLVVVDLSNEAKLVKVRPRRTVTRTSIGGTWYQFKEGQECLVPKHVERMLAQKGII